MLQRAEQRSSLVTRSQENTIHARPSEDTTVKRIKTRRTSAPEKSNMNFDLKREIRHRFNVCQCVIYEDCERWSWASIIVRVTLVKSTLRGLRLSRCHWDWRGATICMNPLRDEVTFRMIFNQCVTLIVVRGRLRLYHLIVSSRKRDITPSALISVNREFD